MDCSLPEALLQHDVHQPLDGLECSFTDGDLSDMLRFFDRHEPISLPGWTVSSMAADGLHHHQEAIPKSPCESSDSDKSSKLPHEGPFASSDSGSPDIGSTLASEAACTAVGMGCRYPQPDCSSATAAAGGGGIHGSYGTQQEGSEGPAVTVSTGRGESHAVHSAVRTALTSTCCSLQLFGPPTQLMLNIVLLQRERTPSATALLRSNAGIASTRLSTSYATWYHRKLL